MGTAISQQPRTSFTFEDNPLEYVKSTYPQLSQSLQKLKLKPTMDNYSKIAILENDIIAKNDNDQYYHIRKDGFLYIGTMQNKRPHGRGYLLFPDGEYYSGQFANGQCQGQGEYYFSQSNLIYSGEWNQNVKEGQGEEKWLATGDNFKGTYENGLRQGFGKMQWANGDFYEGYFHQDKMSGRGLLKKTTKGISTYEGEFLNNKFNGRGVLISTNGSKYEGNFQDGKKHGQGIQSESDGSRFEGQWDKGKRQGRGRLIKFDGNCVEQTYKDGVLEQEIPNQQVEEDKMLIQRQPRIGNQKFVDRQQPQQVTKKEEVIQQQQENKQELQQEQEQEIYYEDEEERREHTFLQSSKVYENNLESQDKDHTMINELNTSKMQKQNDQQTTQTRNCLLDRVDYEQNHSRVNDLIFTQNQQKNENCEHDHSRINEIYNYERYYGDQNQQQTNARQQEHERDHDRILEYNDLNQEQDHSRIHEIQIHDGIQKQQEDQYKYEQDHSRIYELKQDTDKMQNQEYGENEHSRIHELNYEQKQNLQQGGQQQNIFHHQQEHSRILELDQQDAKSEEKQQHSRVNEMVESGNKQNRRDQSQIYMTVQPEMDDVREERGKKNALIKDQDVVESIIVASGEFGGQSEIERPKAKCQQPKYHLDEE